MRELPVRCCIAGGGPAGIMLGYLLARAGIETAVLEKWPDFFRDFRGDTIHPSTMQVLEELGLLQRFLRLPHDETYELTASVGNLEVVLADFSRIRTGRPFIGFIPQWDFLHFIATEAKKYPHFHLFMETECTGLLEEGGRIIGVQAKTGDETWTIHADLVIGADGRHSTAREKSGLSVERFGAPMDVLWFRLPRKKGHPAKTIGRIDKGKMMVLLNRTTYWQCGFIIPKGDIDRIRSEGLAAFRAKLAALEPFLKDCVGEIKTWDQVKLLTVTVDRLKQWYRPGLLCIGDSAHAMSPIGGVGINLAVQDAVAAANILIPAFRRGVPALADLRRVQRRRLFPTRMTQRLQVMIQRNVIRRVLNRRFSDRLPWMLSALHRLPVLRRIFAHIIGVGFRPEHVRTGLFADAVDSGQKGVKRV